MNRIGTEDQAAKDLSRNILLVVGILFATAVGIWTFGAIAASKVHEQAGALASIVGGIVGAGGAAWAVVWQVEKARRRDDDRRNLLVGFILRSSLPFPYPRFSALRSVLDTVAYTESGPEIHSYDMKEIVTYRDIPPELRMQLASIAPEILSMIDVASERVEKTTAAIAALKTHLLPGPGFFNAKITAINLLHSVVVDFAQFYEELDSTQVVGIGNITSSRDDLLREIQKASRYLFDRHFEVHKGTDV